MAPPRIESRERITPLSPGSHGGTLTFSLFDALGRALVMGTYAEEFPSECALARQYGVSLSVTREATKMLATKGLVGAGSQRGTVVQPNDKWNLFDPDVLRWLAALKEPVMLLRQLHELCFVVEPEAAALAAAQAVPAQVSEIGAQVERLRDLEAGGADALNICLDLHLAVLRASNNPFFVRCSDIVTAAFTAATRCAGGCRRFDPDPRAGSAVYTSIVAADTDRARLAMRQLVDETFAGVGSTGVAL